MEFEKILKERLQKQREKNAFRELKDFHCECDFSSNDYLGLAHSALLSENINNAFQRYQNGDPLTFRHHSYQGRFSNINYNKNLPLNGAGGSRLLTGHSEINDLLEEELSAFFNAESSLVFGSGYAANLGVLSSIPTKDDTILMDQKAHACIKDGSQLSRARKWNFRHNDLDDLEKKLTKAQGNKFVVIESIYSMDGDYAPIKDIINLADQYEAVLIVDEAHSTGVVGNHGEGLVDFLGLGDKVPVRIHTFGKAMGIHGACVVGSRAIKDYLINFSRSFIYTTGLPPHSLISILEAFRFLKSQPWLINTLHQKIQYFSHLIRQHIPQMEINEKSPVQVFKIPGNEQVKKLAANLQDAGFDIRPILAPTVPAGEERIRICLHNYNSDASIYQLVAHLVKYHNNLHEQ